MPFYKKSYRVSNVHFKDKMFLNPKINNCLTIKAKPTLFSCEILFNNLLEHYNNNLKQI